MATNTICLPPHENNSSLLWQVRASRNLHADTTARMAYAPLSWYDSTPSGRTMSRFTTDVSQVDLQLSLELDNTFQMSSSLLMLCGLVAVVAPVALVVLGLFVLRGGRDAGVAARAGVVRRRNRRARWGRERKWDLLVMS